MVKYTYNARGSRFISMDDIAYIDPETIIGTKGKFLISKEWWGKFIFGLEFAQPFKIGLDLIRKNI